MAAVVVIGGRHGLGIEVHHSNQPTNVSYCCIAVTFTLTFLLNRCTQASRQSTSVIKVDIVCVGIHGLTRLKEELI